MKKSLVLAALLLSTLSAHAQGPSQCNVGIVDPTYQDGQNRPMSCDTSGHLRTTTTVTANFAGFNPLTTGTPIVAANPSVTGNLPAGAVVVASNVGAVNNAFCKLGAAATTSDQLIPPGGWFAFTVGVATQLTCITSSSTTTVNMVGGSGLPTGASPGPGTVAVSGSVAVTGPLTDAQLRATPVPISGALTANQSVNVAQVAGTATDTNSGVKSAGTIRVVLATDQPALTNKLLVTPDSVALPANQSVNVSQINGVTPLMGAGNTGTGSQRVTVATDQAAIPLAGQGATGAAVPANAVLAGAQSGANMVGLIQASASAQITMSTATTTQFVALSGTTKIYVTSFDVLAAGTTNVTFVYGTGANCGTGTTALAGLYTLTAQSGIAKGSGLGPVLVVPAGNALCVTNSQAIVIGGSISYTQF